MNQSMPQSRKCSLELTGCESNGTGLEGVAWADETISPHVASLFMRQESPMVLVLHVQSPPSDSNHLLTREEEDDEEDEDNKNEENEEEDDDEETSDGYSE